MEQKQILLITVIVLMFFILLGAAFYNPHTEKTSERNWKWSDSWTATVEPQIKPEKPPEPKSESETASQKQIVASSYKDALAKSKELEMRILIIFGSDWCVYCKKLEKELADPEVKKSMKKFVYLHVDTDEDRKTTNKFGISSLPSYLVTDQTEKRLKFGEGYKNANQFLNWLNQ